MTDEQLAAIALAAITAPGFWALLQTLIEKITELITGRKKATLNEIAEQMKNNRRDIDELKKSVSTMRTEESVKDVQSARRRILRFNDELLRNIDHSKEYFDDVLEDVDMYESYCGVHPQFPNGKTTMAAENIKRCYRSCLDKHSFLS